VANHFFNDKAGPDGSFSMSNGSTVVVLATLLLSGSDLAAGPWEESFVRWLAAHDGSVIGLGMAGFDVDEIPWTPDGFAAQHAFVLEVIDAALARHRWELLGFDPPYVARQLAQLRELFAGYRAEFVTPGRHWDPDVAAPAGRCDRHDVLRYRDFGCLLRNDGL
jgi:hypothetical protein